MERISRRNAGHVRRQAASALPACPADQSRYACVSPHCLFSIPLTKEVEADAALCAIVFSRPTSNTSSPMLLLATSLTALSSTRTKPMLAMAAITTALPIPTPHLLAHTPTRTDRRRRPRPSSAPSRATSCRLAEPTTAAVLSWSRRRSVPTLSQGLAISRWAGEVGPSSSPKLATSPSPTLS